MTELELTLSALLAVSWLIMGLLAWKNAGMIPPEIVGMLFSFAERKAAATPQKWDDEALEELRKIYADLKQAEPSA